MHEKGKHERRKALVAIAKKYKNEIKEIGLLVSSIQDAMEIGIVSMIKEEVDRSDLQFYWLTTGQQKTPEFSSAIAKLEAKVKNDLDFSDSQKQEFFKSYFEPMKEFEQQILLTENCLMRGDPPSIWLENDTENLMQYFV